MAEIVRYMGVPLEDFVRLSPDLRDIPSFVLRQMPKRP
jgi:hypothetical protein